MEFNNAVPNMLQVLSGSLQYCLFGALDVHFQKIYWVFEKIGQRHCLDLDASRRLGSVPGLRQYSRSAPPLMRSAVQKKLDLSGLGRERYLVDQRWGRSRSRVSPHWSQNDSHCPRGAPCHSRSLACSCGITTPSSRVRSRARDR